MTAPPRLFDQPATRRARARAIAACGATADRAPQFLLDRVAEDFSDRLSVIRRTFSAALDLGTDHKALADRLIQDGRVPGMVSATSLPTAFADAVVDLEHLPFAAESFDLVVSALALHTVDDLPGVLATVRAALKPDGLFLGALMGGSTLHELRAALLEAETTCTGGASPRVAPAIDVRDLGHLLQRAGFALPVVDSDVVTVTYADPLALLRDLRAMGATNVLAQRSRHFLRRDVLARAVDIYRDRFSTGGNRIRATFEILTMTAWAPHAGQQKPLAPGSAKIRLADALAPKKGDGA